MFLFLLENSIPVTDTAVFHALIPVAKQVFGRKNMNVIEFAKENPLTVILLHGGGLSWWNYRDAAKLLSQNYHVVIPLLDGHANSDNDFTTIENTAEEICDYIQKQLGGSVFAIGGLSLGGQILVEVLSRNPDICRYAVIESAMVIPMTFTSRFIDPLVKMSYGLIKKQWFARLQFKQLHINTDLFDFYYADTCQIKKEDMIAFLKSSSSYRLKDSLGRCTSKVIIAVGGKEGYKMKKSAALLKRYIPDSKMVVFPKYHHGDLSINHPAAYAELFISLNK